MSKIDITLFGGELPRLPPRMLPAQAASTNVNLLPSAPEFHPTLGHLPITPNATWGDGAGSFSNAAAQQGSTLFRGTRDINGNFIAPTDYTTGWYVAQEDVSFVRSQIESDVQDTTYFTHDAGQLPPGWNSVNPGAGGVLGVAAPQNPPSVVLNQALTLTQGQATDWANNTLIPSIVSAVMSVLPSSSNAYNQVACRVSLDSGPGGSTVTAPARTIAGVTSNDISGGIDTGVFDVQFTTNGHPIIQSSLNGHGLNAPWAAYLGMPGEQATLSGLNAQAIGQVPSRTLDANGVPQYIYFPINVLPYFGVLQDPSFPVAAGNNTACLARQAALKTALLAIPDPRDPTGQTALFNTTYLNSTDSSSLLPQILALFDPTASDVMAQRSVLDANYNAFGTAIYQVMQNIAQESVTLAPVTSTAYYTAGVPTTITAAPNPALYKPVAATSVTYLQSQQGPQASGPSQTWAQYQLDLAAWNAASTSNATLIQNATALNAGQVQTIVQAQANCAAATKAIEQLYAGRIANLTALINDVIGTVGLIQDPIANPSGIIQVNADPIIDTRCYCYTWVTDRGWESAPSPVSTLVNVNLSGPDTVSVIPQDSPPSGTFTGNNIVKWRLYRTNSGTSSTEFQLVSENPIAGLITGSGAFSGSTGTGAYASNTWQDIVATYIVQSNRTGVWSSIPVDNSHLLVGDKVTEISTGYSETKYWNGSSWSIFPVTVSGIGQIGFVDGMLGSQLGYILPTIGWAMPPGTLPTTKGLATTWDPAYPSFLRGLTGGPGGVMAGFVGNTVAFCQPSVPYAWPVAYQIPVEYPVVGLASFGQTWFVGTQGRPYFINGTDPSNYSVQVLDSMESCARDRSIVTGTRGVYYASPNGYCLANLQGVVNITKELFAREDWQKLDPSSIFAIMHDDILMWWYQGPGVEGQGPISPGQEGKLNGYALDVNTGKLIEMDFYCTAVFNDVATDSVFALAPADQVHQSNWTVHKLFDPTVPRRTGDWFSKQYSFPSDTSFAWLRIKGNQSASNPVNFQLYAIDQDALNDLTDVWTKPNQALKCIYPVQTDNVNNPLFVSVVNADPMILPAGSYREFVVRIQGTAIIERVILTSSIEEMMVAE